MSHFLESIASRYWTEYQKGISDYTFVFPNRRAGLFFRRYLSEIAGTPIFAPSCITINQLFEQLSEIRKVEQIDALFLLYESYIEKYLKPNRIDNGFEEFIYWGQMLLNDFAEVDRNLIDARAIFSNISDLKDIELLFNDLDLTQRESLERFLSGFQGNNLSDNRKRFLHFWKTLYPIYQHFTDNLLKKGLGTMSMIAREVAQKPDVIEKASSNYVFIGFNALTETEKRLMLELQKNDKADFYFDYDSPFLSDPQNRASLFKEDNLQLFKSKFEIQSNLHNNPEIHLIKIPSYIGQAQKIAQILNDIDSSTDLTRIGVVMPDENMLLPVLEHIPDNITDINITMGMPLKATPIYSLIQHLDQLQQRKAQKPHKAFYYKPVMALLSHPYIIADTARTIQQTMLQNNFTYTPIDIFANDEQMKTIFTFVDSNDTIKYIRQVLSTLFTDEDMVRNGYINSTINVVNKLDEYLKRHSNIYSNISQKTIFLLLRRLLDTVSFPFDGEPLQGLQIMGMLESRGMDFETLILTSVNDDTLPGKHLTNSYVPTDIRRAYGLPTQERQDSIYAYNFYRLISTAKNVYLLENSLADENHSAETSRFVMQLEYQYNIPINKEIITYRIPASLNEDLIINKTPKVIQQIEDKLCQKEHSNSHTGISASALNTYVSCPLKFYLDYILKYHEPNQIEEEMRMSEFGTVLHAVMQRLYDSTLEKHNGYITEQIIAQLIKTATESQIVEEEYKKTFIKTYTETHQQYDFELEGKDRLPIHVIRQYVLRVLNYDKKLCPFRYLQSEQYAQMTINVQGKPILIKGIIDRVDEIDGKIRIVDYKTGSEHSDFPSLEQLYSFDEAKDSDHVRQTLYYCKLYSSLYPSRDFEPHIYYVKAKENDLDKEIFYNSDMHGYKSMENAYNKSLTNILQEILDPAVPFVARIDKRGKCANCQFKQICVIE